MDDERIYIGLRAINTMIDDLIALASPPHEWDTLSEGERVSISLDWDHYMYSYVGLMRDYHNRGALDPVQHKGYHECQQRIASISDVLDRLQLTNNTDKE